MDCTCNFKGHFANDDCTCGAKNDNLSESGFNALLDGVTKLSHPDFHLLNKRGQRLLHACLCAYAKHSCDVEEIGWDELGDILCNAICEEIGDENYRKWLRNIGEETV